MIRQQVYILNNILMLLDALCIIFAGYAAFYGKLYLSDSTWSMDEAIFTGAILLVMFVNNYVMGRLHLYSETKPASNGSLIFAVAKAVVISFLCLVTGIYLLKQHEISREFVGLFAIFSFVFLCVERLIARLYINGIAHRTFHARKILVVGNMERGKYVSDLLSQQLSWGHEVVGMLAVDDEEAKAPECLGKIEELALILRKFPVDEVIFAAHGGRSVDIGAYTQVCKKMGIPSRILPALWQPGETSISAERCQGVPFLVVAAENINATGLMYKRMLDCLGGLIGSLVFCILYPVISVAIKLDSPGPVLFRQERVGRNGRVFHILKFRTMYQDAEARKQELMALNEMQGAMFKLQDDPRITKVGRWLRKTSLDEFPQFLNVLKGEMSLVGTRPPTLAEVEQYDLWHRRRISAKPGITGLWQISGRNAITDFDKVVELDCRYLDQWRFSDDIWILLKTIVVVFQRKGAS
ncbi:MAG: sugar transferase [Desulfobulbaceae bacterium]|nr:sugar transferase [Desulfobulbaceae bacterium]HIJ91205.1 sugar transferase [Deltaproteobacteria bacterium]